MDGEKVKEAVFTLLVVLAMIPMTFTALTVMHTAEDWLLLLLGIAIGVGFEQVFLFVFEYVLDCWDIQQ
jgi:uncharacterized membrane protein